MSFCRYSESCKRTMVMHEEKEAIRVPWNILWLPATKRLCCNMSNSFIFSFEVRYIFTTLSCSILVCICFCEPYNKYIVFVFNLFYNFVQVPSCNLNNKYEKMKENEMKNSLHYNLKLLNIGKLHTFFTILTFISPTGQIKLSMFKTKTLKIVFPQLCTLA